MTMKPIIFSIIFAGIGIVAACSSVPNSSSGQVFKQQQILQAQQIVWRVSSIHGYHLSHAERSHQPYLRFDMTNKQVSGSDGCNHIFGSYQLQGHILHLSPLASTKMMCMDSMQISDQFHLALAQVEYFEVKHRVLILKDQSKQVIMELHPETLLK